MSKHSLPNNEKHASMLPTLWKLGTPTLIEEALRVMVTYIDTAMVGAIGAVASAAVGLTSTVVWLQAGLMFGFALSYLGHIARAAGAGDDRMAHRMSIQALWVMLAMGVAETIIFCACAFKIPVWMQGSPEICHDAGVYFFIFSLSTLFKSSTIILGTVLRANKDTKTPMYANLGMNLLNIILNQLMIGPGTTFTVLGLSIFVPGLGWGVAGAAIATTIAQVVGGTIIFIAFLRNPLTTPKGYDRSIDWKIQKRCARTALPILGERFVMEIGYITFSALVASLGTLATAAHSIALTIEQAFYIPGYGIQQAISTLCGNAVGRQDKKELSAVIRAGLLSAVSIMSFMSLFLFFFSDVAMGIFTPSMEVVALGGAALKLVACSEPFFAVQIILEGTFRGVGETKIPFYYALFCMWGIRILGTWIAVSFFHAGLSTVWLCMIADNMVKCALMVWLYKKGSWRARMGVA